jgi:hypothetical protein
MKPTIRHAIHALLFALGVFILATTIFAQDAIQSVPATAPDAVAKLVADLAGQHPWIASVLAVIGICRVLVKPLFTFLHAVVQVTPSTRDDELLAKAEASTWFRWLNWVLDYVFSIKLIHPSTQSSKP